MFSKLSKRTLARAALLQDAPVYVQFYVTARCNLTCEQCNIIYANADVREVTIDEVERIADNFAEMGVAIVLLTGGEPFARRDLAQIIKAFETRGVHVRMQTNGFANEERIIEAIEAGGCDISISLDSLHGATQDKINGDFDESWHQALKAIATFTQHLPKKDSFASLGCVMQPGNLGDIEDVIRFGTEISWFTSLVPVHVTKFRRPRGFRTFDQTLSFRPEEADEADKLLDRVRAMRKEGFLLYDSDQYLDDIKEFIRDKPTSWRRKNSGVCDSPNLYFALLPNGNFAPCCDFRLPSKYPAYDPAFPKLYRDSVFRDEVHEVVKACDGCMYGSYPEITISMRFLAAKIQRTQTFLTSPPEKKWPFTYEELLEKAQRIRSEPRNRPISRQDQTKKAS
ncbi:radical SAM protein [uncultured Roseobacter sp.]|uniref:radical SAM protein n=1 Tax=uncultured Roseobacter sp. TaxID=114847 RepID=UPI002618134D|nr:radical SAM protein [uncultured Roseobacter sp.]